MPSLDFGDAPASYGKAGHLVPPAPKVYLGALSPDKEAHPQNAANGSIDGLGDDKTALHDEDSIQLLPPLRALDTSYQVNVSTHNSSADNATLIAWIDFNNDGVFDANEAATVTVNAGAGGTKSLVWNNIPAGTIQSDAVWMRIRISTDPNLTTSNPDKALFDGEVEDYTIKIVQGVKVSGFVFDDLNVSAGTKEATDKGLNNVTVVLSDGNSCVSTKTDSTGFYQFENVAAGSYTLYEAANERIATPKTCPPVTQDLTGFRSTSDNMRAITVAANDISNEDFADVQLPAFSPNHSKTISPNNVVSYAHTFSAKSSGTVDFSVSSNAAITNGWSSTLYRDSNCNGVLDGAEASAPIAANIATNAGENICIINKVYAPNNVANGETYSNVINAVFDFNANPLAGDITLTVTDLTKAAANDAPETGTSKLELRKTVQNITQGGVETETQNQAKPGDILKYRIYYSNVGNAPLTELIVNDTVPEFTSIEGSPVCETPLPASLTSCTPNVIGDDIEWVFPASDALKAGASGVVSYEVKID